MPKAASSSPLPVEERSRNPWPAAWEDAFWDRANANLCAADVPPGNYGGTFFENEKTSHSNAFIGFLKEQRTEALKFLQQHDSELLSRQLLAKKLAGSKNRSAGELRKTTEEIETLVLQFARQNRSWG